MAQVWSSLFGNNPYMSRSSDTLNLLLDQSEGVFSPSVQYGVFLKNWGLIMPTQNRHLYGLLANMEKCVSRSKFQNVLPSGERALVRHEVDGSLDGRGVHHTKHRHRQDSTRRLGDTKSRVWVRPYAVQLLLPAQQRPGRGPPFPAPSSGCCRGGTDGRRWSTIGR